MRCSMVLVLCGLSLSCSKASSPDSTPSEASPKAAAAGDKSTIAAKASASRERLRELPALPNDLEEAFGPAHRAISSRLAAPRPELKEPWPTEAKHDAWVKKVVDPWHEKWTAAAMKAHNARPTIADDADDAAWDKYSRARYVHTILTRTQTLEDAQVLAALPLPSEVSSDATALAEARREVQPNLDMTLEVVHQWAKACDEFAGGEAPLPADLQPWSDHCRAHVSQTVAVVCGAERAYGLEASVPCSGTRALVDPAPPPPASKDSKVRSMQEMTQLFDEAHTVCFVAEEVVDDDVAEGERIKEWKSRLEDEDLSHPEILQAVDRAVAAGRSEATLTAFVDTMEKVGGPSWECPELFDILAG